MLVFVTVDFGNSIENDFSRWADESLDKFGTTTLGISDFSPALSLPHSHPHFLGCRWRQWSFPSSTSYFQLDRATTVKGLLSSRVYFHQSQDDGSEVLKV